MSKFLYVWIGSLLGGLLLFCGVSAADLQDHCDEIFDEQKTCPENLCRLECLQYSKEGGCTVSVCLAKECFEIEPKYCPGLYCHILKGCDGTDVCYTRETHQVDECGEAAYAGERECCDGFVKRCGVEYFDGSCDMTPMYSAQAVPICLPCGNGICNQFENRCNCPEDCAPKNGSGDLQKEGLSEDIDTDQ